MHHAPIEAHNILLDTLFGFRSKHSSESQLLLTTTDLAKAIDRRLQIDIGSYNYLTFLRRLTRYPIP